MFRVPATLLALVVSAMSVACARDAAAPAPPATPSYAIYAEFAEKENKLMKNGLNRRVFNKTEAQSGADIARNADGSITLEPGTYRITGVSTVTMQTTLAPPTFPHNNTYVGYAMIYPVSAENAGMGTLKQAIAISTPSAAAYFAPAVFDTVYTATEKVTIAVGHQAGNELNNEVYLSVYDVGGEKSEYHAVARVAITRIDR
jgi:hypothetical protein